MKNSGVLIGIAVAVGLALLIFFGLKISVNNTVVSLEEQLESCDSDVQVQEKRRSDLIYNLADTVKHYDKHEAETLLAIVEARKSEGKDVTVKEISNQVDVVAEAYPELKSSENYNTLMTELSLTENRIAEHRKAYNNQVREYNKFIRKFPNKQILAVDGYEPVNYTYLEYSEAERETPKNIFGDN